MSEESEMDEIFTYKAINEQLKKNKENNDETMEEPIITPETLSDQTKESTEGYIARNINNA